MKKAAPGARNKIWGDALTKWNVSWHYGLTQIPGGCRVNNVTASVQVTFIMPRWKNRADGSQELREKWDKYLEALQKHENGHKAHGINAAEEIESEIKSLRPSRSCGEVQRAVNTCANGILAKYRREDLYYDILTVHGATQGAVF